MGKRIKLKCDPVFYLALRDGRKTAEIRFDDRDYQTGDILEIKAFDRHNKIYLEDSPYDATLFFDVSHVLKGAPYLPDGYVMCSLKNRLS